MSLSSFYTNSGKAQTMTEAPVRRASIVAPGLPVVSGGSKGQPIVNDGLRLVGGLDVLSTNLGMEPGFKAAKSHGASQQLKRLPATTDLTAARGPRARFFDPLSLVYASGYRDRRFSLTYDTIRRTVYQLSLLGSIILTRIYQVASFAQPYRENQQIGFKIGYKDDTYIPREEQRREIVELERMVMACGFDRNPHNTEPRDDFETFLKKITRDSLQFDQMCAVKGTWVELADGTGVPVECIESGMVVRSHNGVEREVIHPTSRLYSGEMVEIQVRGQRLNVTTGHPLLVAKRSSVDGNAVAFKEPEWIAAGEVTDRDYALYPRPLLGREDISLDVFAQEPRKFPVGPMDRLVELADCHPKTARDILSGTYKKNGLLVAEVKALAKELGVSMEYKRTWQPKTELTTAWGRFLGLYCAEGHVQGTSVRLTFHEDEAGLVEFVRSFGSLYGIESSVTEYLDRAGVTVILYSSALAEFLKNHCGTGSSEKRVPSFILGAQKMVKEHFLLGYLEGDGHLKKTTAHFTTTSRNLFTGLRLLFADQGIYVAEVKVPSAREQWDEQYAGSLSGPAYRTLARSLGLPVEEPSKERKSYHVGEKFFYVKVSAVRKYEVENLRVFNMEVEEDHSYVAEGIVNHNCFEIVPDSKGRPAEFHAVDAATIRLAATYDNHKPGKAPRKFHSAEFSEDWKQERDLGEDFVVQDDQIQTVQVIHGKIENIFTAGDMAFGIRNPRSDLWVNGYGFSETEMCLSTVLRMLWSEEYNARNFRQGNMSGGFLNLKGETYDPGTIETFKRVIRANALGWENAHRVPILQIPEGIEFVNLQRGNREMEYGRWQEYLLKIISGVYQIDPAEINFDIGKASSQGQPMFENKAEWKIKYSKDKGLRPLLRFLARQISKYIIEPLNPDLYFDFVGLDKMSEPERIDLLTRQVTTYLTINEGREKEGRDPVVGGDVILNPVYFQAKAQAEQVPIKADNPMAPWATSGDGDPLEHGTAPAIPLYFQEGGEDFDPAPPPMDPGGMPPGMEPPGGGAGMPIPGMIGSPGGPGPGTPGAI